MHGACDYIIEPATEDDDPELAHAPPAVNGRRHAAAIEAGNPNRAYVLPADDVVAMPPPWRPATRSLPTT